MKKIKNFSFAELKVYKNSRTGQMTVPLPRKLIKKDIKKVKVKWLQ